MSFVVSPPAVVGLPVAGSTDLFPVRRVYCVGRNYAAHAREMGFDPDREPPFFFCKPNDDASIVPVSAGKAASIPYPGQTANYHYEAELVVLIGKGGRDISVDDAVNHIYGYAVGLDMTRRDLQMKMREQGRPWEIGKAFEQSAPIGPIVPVAQAGDAENAEISVQVNGIDRQRSTVGKLIWNVAETIEHLSAAWELQPGDLIFTGTPEGVAAVGRGDVLKAEVSGVGSLQVTLV